MRCIFEGSIEIQTTKLIKMKTIETKEVAGRELRIIENGTEYFLEIYIAGKHVATEGLPNTNGRKGHKTVEELKANCVRWN